MYIRIAISLKWNCSCCRETTDSIVLHRIKKNKKGHSDVVQRDIFEAREVFGISLSGMLKELCCASALYWTKRILAYWDTCTRNYRTEAMEN